MVSSSNTNCGAWPHTHTLRLSLGLNDRGHCALSFLSAPCRFSSAPCRFYRLPVVFPQRPVVFIGSLSFFLSALSFLSAPCRFSSAPCRFYRLPVVFPQRPVVFIGTPPFFREPFGFFGLLSALFWAWSCRKHPIEANRGTIFVHHVVFMSEHSRHVGFTSQISAWEWGYANGIWRNVSFAIVYLWKVVQGFMNINKIQLILIYAN